jgi:transcription factor IIIB subunit 2
LSDSLPLVDPSHYISRFAALLEFGDETHKVAADAVRLVARMDRDWMTHGRRPAGICGACLLLAARMNNFRRSVAEIVQVVKIADTTLMKRLEEFRKTPSGQMTVADFRSVWLEDEMDPPAFTKGREKEALKADRERIIREGGDPDEGGRVGKRKKKGRKKRKRDETENYEQEIQFEDQQTQSQTPGAGPSTEPTQPFDPQLLSQGIFEGTDATPTTALFLPEPPGEEEGIHEQNIDPALLSLSQPQSSSATQTLTDDPDPLDETANTLLTEEVTTFLNTTQGSELSSALKDAEARRLAQIEPVDELQGLDEEELDRFILSEDEVKVRERVWVEINKDYLEALAGMCSH